MVREDANDANKRMAQKWQSKKCAERFTKNCRLFAKNRRIIRAKLANWIISWISKSEKELKEVNERFKNAHTVWRKERDDNELTLKAKEEDLLQARERVVQIEREVK